MRFRRNHILSASVAMSLVMSLSCRKKSDDDSSGDASNPTDPNGNTSSVATLLMAPAGSLSLISKAGSPQLWEDEALSLVAGSDYDTDLKGAKIRVKTDATEAAATVSSIMCAMKQLNMPQNVGAGKVAALVSSSCFEGDGGGDGENSQKKSMKFFMNVTRETDTSPLLAKINVVDDKQKIYIEFKGLSGPTDTNPAGIFDMRFIMDGGAGGGYLVSSVDAEGKANIKYYESGKRTENFGQGSATPAVMTFINSINAKLLTKGGKIDSGVFSSRIKFDVAGRPDYSKDKNFKVAFSGGSAKENDTCYDIENPTGSVFRYGMYRVDNESRVALKGDIPVTYSSGGKDYRGSVGYRGAWFEGNQSPSDGSALVYTDFKTNAKTNYTAVVRKYKLIKNTQVPLTAADIKGVPLNSFANGKQVRVVFDGTTFNRTGSKSNNMGDYTDEAPTAYTMMNGQNFFGGDMGSLTVFMSSASSAGSAVTRITFTKREDITASAGDLSLKCFNRCPKAAIVDADVGSSGSPYSDPSSLDIASMITYSWTKSGMAMTRAGTTVGLASTISSLSGQYGGGVQSGPLFLASDVSAAATNQDLFKLSTYYSFEMGTNQWNQFFGMKDSGGSFVTFDAPISFTYTHKTANDLSGSDKFNDRKFQLSYAGFGQLWGFPSSQDSNGMYMPKVSLKTGTVVGAASEYKVLPLGGFYTPSKVDAAKCSGLDTESAPAQAEDGGTIAFTTIMTDAEANAAKIVSIDGVQQ